MTLDRVRQSVLVDMAYEIGGVGLAGFVKFLAAVRAGMWATAAVELSNSQLFSQVPAREQSNIAMLTTGQFHGGMTSAEDVVHAHEGCVLVAKPDAKGKWEIGWGHDIPASMTDDPSIMTCTQDQADAWFATDMALATQRAEADLGAEYWGN